jgi:hypothetical protein
MLAYQPLLPLPRPAWARMRSVRRPFHPSHHAGPYRLPHEVRTHLASALASFRNREAAFALATFIARFWSMSGRVVGSFPIDRRALADHPDLALTEAQVRGAIRTLEAVGYLERAIPPKGSRHRLTSGGELHRKVILFAFGGDYAPHFIKANRRAAAARGRAPGERRSIPAETARQPSVGIPVTSPLKSPKGKSVAVSQVIMGELRKRPPSPTEPNSQLEAALARLEEGYRQSRGRLATSPEPHPAPKASI